MENGFMRGAVHSAHAAYIADLDESFKTEVARLSKQYIADVYRLTSDYKGIAKAELERLCAQHSNEIDQLASKHKGTLRHLQAQLTKEKESANERLQKCLDEDGGVNKATPTMSVEGVRDSAQHAEEAMEQATKKGGPSQPKQTSTTADSRRQAINGAGVSGPRPPSSSANPIDAQPTSGKASSGHTSFSTPMSAKQKASLMEKMQNLKKSKHSIAFLRPVDWEALNIPTYPEIVKQPMDLMTMDEKLKSGKYATVDDLVKDFDLIINNARLFNGDAHVVTQAGARLDAYFRRMMETLPGSNEGGAATVPAKRPASVLDTNSEKRKA